MWRAWPRETPAQRHLRLGNDLARAGRRLEAGRQWQIAVALDPKQVEAREALARAYLADGAVAPAIREFQTVTKLAPGRRHAYCQLAEALQEGELDEPARLAANYAAKLELRCPRPRRVLGILHADRNEFAQALKELDAAASLAPRDAEIRRILARLHLGLSQLSQAEARARQAYRLEPRHPEGPYLVAFALLEQSDPSRRREVEDLLLTTLTLREEHADAHAALGRLYKTQGRLPQARRELERALALAPRHRNALQQLADLAATMGDAKRAADLRRRGAALAAEDLRRRELERHLAQNPADGRALYELGDLCARDGQHLRAIELLERAREVLAHDPEVLVRLEQVRAALRRGMKR